MSPVRARDQAARGPARTDPNRQGQAAFGPAASYAELMLRHLSSTVVATVLESCLRECGTDEVPFAAARAAVQDAGGER